MSEADGALPLAPSFARFCERYFRALAAGVLILAACNLYFRLNRELVTEWDESLYAISAAETAANGNWIGTTFQGALDYYNTKPPLNIWLIAASFKTFGASLWSLRLPSATAAWLTVLVLILWARRAFGAAVALTAGLVLSTTFGFLYVHSGRSANTDALFTLLLLLIVIVMWSAERKPWRLIWLGPLAAGIFMLRGLAVLMPLAMIASVVVLGGTGLRDRWRPLLAAALLAAAPVAAWVAARWQIDQWQFLERMFHYDFVARSATALEGHTGTILYYPNVLQKDQYDWLLAMAAALVLYPVSRQRLRALLTESPGDRYRRVVAGAWIGVTLLVPTLMKTKVAWYLNPFFPIFALLVAAAVVHGFERSMPGTRRRYIFAALVLLAFAVAQAKLVWYSHNMRDLSISAQGVMLQERERLAGRRIYRERWPHNGRFVAEHLIGSQALEARDARQFAKKAQPGDYMLLPMSDVDAAGLRCVSTNRRFALCEFP